MMAGIERVVLLEDHEMLLEGLEAVLEVDDRIDVVGTASSLADFRLGFDEWNPTVVVADYNLPDGTGTELAASLRDSEASCAVLLISGSERPRLLEEAIDSGCAGFLSKGLGTSDLADAIATVGRGATVFPADAIRSHGRNDDSVLGRNLTERELEVLSLLANANSAPEIAEKLFVSVHTARNHIRSVLTKLHARSQLDAVVIALRSGIVDIARN